MTENLTTQPQLRVLAIDDEPAIRDVYRLGLTQFGCQVQTAGSGREALQTMMQQSFDVLIVDIRMAEMSGIVFLQEALKIWPWVGVVIVSGHITPAVLDEAHTLGVTRVLHKPVTLRDLYDSVTGEAEARSKLRADIPRGNALALMKDHLKLLSRLDAQTLGTHSLMGALLEFGRDLGRMMPSDVVGILVMEEDEQSLLLTPQTGVSDLFLAAVQQEMITRYHALSGAPVDLGRLTVRTEGITTRTEGPHAVGSSLSVPVILGQDVCGLLTLATSSLRAYDQSDVSLLYHAANHIAAVFMALRRMHQLATRDPLTGLYNRIRLEEDLEHAWQLSRRYDPAVSVVVVDVDHFKILNDTYGHAVGDEILRSFADILRQAARASDITARYGGDEFVAILPRAEEENARVFAERLLRRTREHVFCPSSHRLSLSISVGIATSNNPARPTSSAELLGQADRALYLAKRAGRNRICVWPGDEKPADAQSGAGGSEVVVGAKQRTRVIVVDDEPAILRLLGALLQRDSFEVTTFTSGHEAVTAVCEKPHHFDVILTDIAMPGMTGIELLKELADGDDLIVKIVMTGYATVDNAVQCLREGAYDFIQKPIETKHFEAVMRRALEYRSLRMENARHQAQLERMVAQRSAQLSRTLEEVKASYEFTLEAFMAMLDSREHQTGRHSLRVRELATALARSMGVRGTELDAVSTGALLHDIGKIGVPDKVLFHAGPLSPDEWRIMKNHPELGYRILQRSPHLHEAAQIVREHHERYDGQGYPRGLSGEDICLGARIFGVADAYDAMRSDRIYRNAMPPDQAAEEITQNRGRQFDPQVVDAFLACRTELEELFRRVSDAGAPLPDAMPGAPP